MSVEEINKLNKMALENIRKIVEELNNFNGVIREKSYNNDVDGLKAINVKLLKTLIYITKGEVDEKINYSNVIGNMVVGLECLSDYI